MKLRRNCLIAIILLMGLMATIYSHGYCDNTDVTDLRMQPFARDQKGMKIPPFVVYNPGSQTYEAVYFTSDSNDFINVTVASGTINATVAGPVAVTGTFWPVTQPVSGTFWQGTQPVSGTFWQATQPVSQSSTTSGVTAYIDGTIPVTQSGLWEISAGTLTHVDSCILRDTYGNAIYVDDMDLDTVIISNNVLGVAAFNYALEPVSNRMARLRCSPNFELQVINSTQSLTRTQWDIEVTTSTSGKLNSSGNIPNTAFTVEGYAFHNAGDSESSYTGLLGGTAYVAGDIADNGPGYPLNIATPTIAVALGAGNTWYYRIWGKE